MDVSSKNITANRHTMLNIFMTFLKVGTIMLGGGYVVLPILQSEIVEKKKWLSSEELTDYYAISQSLPGMIAINISVLTGYKILGKRGAISAVLGITFSAFWAIVLLSSIIAQFISNKYVQGMFWGIDIAVVVLIISAIREMWSKSVTDIKTVIIYLIALGLMIFTKVSPAYIILIAAVLGVIYKVFERKREEIK